MEYHIGIDVGTTNLKAALFTQDGFLIAYHSKPTPVLHPKKEWSEFDPFAVWKGIAACLKNIVGAVNPEKICSVGISSFGESGLLADWTGMPLTNAIAWYDPRAKEQIAFVKKRLGEERIYSVTGQTASDKYGICKLLWWKDNEPTLYKKAAHWLSMEDWILFCLTGKIATDYSIAARTMVFDIHKLCWSEELLEGISVKQDLFSEAFPGGTRIGTVIREAAELTGLSTNTSVSTGGHDHACASIAVNIFEDGVVLDSMGTAEVSMIAVKEPILTPQTRENFYSCYPHCGEKLYRVITSNQSCGACIEWYLKAFGKEWVEQERKTGKSRYDSVMELMETTSSERGELYFLPFLRGSVEDRNLRGVFFGLEDTHVQGDFVEAILNGICYELKKQIDGYSSLFGEDYYRLRVVGGLSKSRWIMEKKAKIQQSLIEVPACTEAACLGAAFLGAIGAGRNSFGDLSKLYKSGMTYQGKKDAVESRKYETYLSIRGGIKKIYAGLYER